MRKCDIFVLLWPLFFSWLLIIVVESASVILERSKWSDMLLLVLVLSFALVGSLMIVRSTVRGASSMMTTGSMSSSMMMASVLMRVLFFLMFLRLFIIIVLDLSSLKFVSSIDIQKFLLSITKEMFLLFLFLITEPDPISVTLVFRESFIHESIRINLIMIMKRHVVIAIPLLLWFLLARRVRTLMRILMRILMRALMRAFMRALMRALMLLRELWILTLMRALIIELVVGWLVRSMWLVIALSTCSSTQQGHCE